MKDCNILPGRQELLQVPLTSHQLPLAYIFQLELSLLTSGNSTPLPTTPTLPVCYLFFLILLCFITYNIKLETYTFPAWMNANPQIPGDLGGLAPGAAHNFGCIFTSHSPAEVVITEVKCDGLPSISPSTILCNVCY